MVIDASDSSWSSENVNRARWILHGAEAPFISLSCAGGEGGRGGAPVIHNTATWSLTGPTRGGRPNYIGAAVYEDEYV